VKVSIVPRGSDALGFAQYLPQNNYLLTKEQILDKVRLSIFSFFPSPPLP
jgi:ATP-dependent Zn protease